MRELLIMCFVLLIIIFGSIYICNYLKKTSEEIIFELEELRKSLYKENVSTIELIKKVDSIKLKWNKIKDGWSNIILHQEIDSIETSLIRLESKIETENRKEAVEDLETAIFLLGHIKEKEEVNIKNIF